TALLLTSGTTPAGILRLFNRFDLQVYSETVAQIVRLIGCLVGWGIGASVVWFLGVWALAALLLVVSQWAAVLSLGHRISFGRKALRLTVHENRSLWSFMLKTNVSSSLSLFWLQCGTLVVGVRAGAVEAGGFRLAHRFSLAMMKPVEIAAKALFPELARLIAEGDHAAVRRVLARVSWLSALFASVMVLLSALFGREILRLVAGSGFEFAHQFLFLLCIAAAINIAGFALEPFHNAHFRPGIVLRSYAVAAVVYGGALLLLLPSFGAEGAAFASIAAAAALMAQLGVSTFRILSGSTLHDQDAANRPEQVQPAVASSETGQALRT
ncbi:MAG: lipopolysaccharide biosynthesis protein, partial [Sphingomicrobium sp.]